MLQSSECMYQKFNDDFLESICISVKKMSKNCLMSCNIWPNWFCYSLMSITCIFIWLLFFFCYTLLGMPLVPALQVFVAHPSSKWLISHSTFLLEAYQSVWVTFQSQFLVLRHNSCFTLSSLFLNACYCRCCKSISKVALWYSTNVVSLTFRFLNTCYFVFL